MLGVMTIMWSMMEILLDPIRNPKTHGMKTWILETRVKDTILGGTISLHSPGKLDSIVTSQLEVG